MGGIYYSIKSLVCILCRYSAEFLSMAKNAVTPEVTEVILTKIADKFTDALNSIMSQFSSMLANTVTLESEETAHDLLESAAILQRSCDNNIRKVYFNPDLTKTQATEAYKRRCEKRAQRLSTFAIPAGSLFASAFLFLPSQYLLWQMGLNQCTQLVY